jgi:L-aminopeptidase/D-esterase-like protein
MSTEIRKTNCHLSLTPVSSLAKRVLEFNFPHLRIGSAEYREGPTGCTVFQFDRYVSCAVDLRGGSSCAVLLDGWETGDAQVDAICFAGGSCCGVEAIGGVTTAIFSNRPDGHLFNRLARVMGAIIYDYRPRDNSVYPDKLLGEFAANNLTSGRFPLGAHGAGSSATVGKGPDYDLWEICGQGGAFRNVGGFSIGVFTVVNAIGALVDRSNNTVRGHFDRSSGKRMSYGEVLARPSNSKGIAPGGNTTHTLLVTDLMMTPYQLRQLARSVHSSMARAIHPFHALGDGDAFFAVSTQSVQGGSRSYAELLGASADLAWDAVLSSFDPNS